MFDIAEFSNVIKNTESKLEEFEIHGVYPILGERYFQIKYVNLQYNIKHLNFKLVIINDITDIKQAIFELNSKHLRLTEMHHRTKNNLYMIEGILRLQLNDSADPALRQFLIDNISRISSIANIHMMLTETSEFRNVSIKIFIEKLIDNIKTLYPQPVLFELDLIDIELDFNISLYLGIVLNEIVTNSFKHAFDNASKVLEPKIKIQLKEGSFKNNYSLSVADNGSCADKKLDIDKSTGVKLIRQIVESNLHGHIDANYRNGMVYVIHFEAS